MNVKGNTSRFLIWRAYHQIVDHLGRNPCAREIAEIVDLSPEHIRKVVSDMKTVTLSREVGQYRNGGQWYRVHTLRDVFTMMGQNDDR